MFNYTKKLGKKLSKLPSYLRGKGVPVDKNIWESEYLRGRWDYMSGVGELPRYSLITGYFRYLKPMGSLIDVGCGEGILPARLGPQSYSRYIGIDISHEALVMAINRVRNNNTYFMEADVSTYVPKGSFDAIVFCEVLNYFSDPLAVVKNYESALNKDGIFIVSILHNVWKKSIWKVLEK